MHAKLHNINFTDPGLWKEKFPDGMEIVFSNLLGVRGEKWHFLEIVERGPVYLTRLFELRNNGTGQMSTAAMQ